MFFKNIGKTFDEKVLIEIDLLMKEGIYPSIGKIATRMGKANSLKSVQIATDKLEEEGYITKDEERKIADITQIGRELLGAGKIIKNIFNSFNIPILGSVACGAPTYANENIEGYLAVSGDIVSSYNKDDYFILKGDGDSMDKLGINEGDLLLIKNQSHVRNGDIVLALISNESATLKEYQESSNEEFIKLLPHSNNPIHKPIIVPFDSIIIQGVFQENLGQFNS